MFIKTTKSKNHTYLQIVESFREGKTTRHKVIANLGRLDHLLDSGYLQSMGQKLLSLNNTPCIGAENLQETARFCYGHLVYQKVWEQLGIGEIIKKCAKGTRIKFDLEEVIFYCVIHRLLKSKSKRQAFKDQELFYGIKRIKGLQEIYRSLDFLSAKKQAIETQLFHNRKGVYAKPIEIAFYDVTNYHFESNKSDSLREFGFSKAGKFNEVQVVMGLFIDSTGRPIGYDLFAGNTFDGQTMVDALKMLERQFNIRKVIVVADKGLNSKQNFHLIRQAGYDYIVSARLKSMPKELVQKILDTNDMETKAVCEDTGEVTFSWKVLDYEANYTDANNNEQKLQDKLLVTWSAKRAAKDSKDRERQIQKAKAKLANGADLQNKKGANRFLKTADNTHTKAIEIDQKRIVEDTKWDGYYGIQFSKTTRGRDRNALKCFVRKGF
ncbi:IS1634 family transposase, partial [Sphingobacteriales bacterium UPWRP_1]